MRTNADYPRDAKQALELGAEGIGLCRTEHMFFEQERLPIVQEMILAKDEARGRRAGPATAHSATDFDGIFEAMAGKPVTIRLIDLPLHEFLPSYEELLVEATELCGRVDKRETLHKKEEMLHAVEDMREANPMLGLRGCRLSIVFPGIVRMQIRAILQAAADVKKPAWRLTRRL